MLLNHQCLLTFPPLSLAISLLHCVSACINVKGLSQTCLSLPVRDSPHLESAHEAHLSPPLVNICSPLALSHVSSLCLGRNPSLVYENSSSYQNLTMSYVAGELRPFPVVWLCSVVSELGRPLLHWCIVYYNNAFWQGYTYTGLHRESCPHRRYENCKFGWERKFPYAKKLKFSTV